MRDNDCWKHLSLKRFAETAEMNPLVGFPLLVGLLLFGAIIEFGVAPLLDSMER